MRKVAAVGMLVLAVVLGGGAAIKTLDTPWTGTPANTATQATGQDTPWTAQAGAATPGDTPWTAPATPGDTPWTSDTNPTDTPW